MPNYLWAKPKEFAEGDTRNLQQGTEPRFNVLDWYPKHWACLPLYPSNIYHWESDDYIPLAGSPSLQNNQILSINNKQLIQAAKKMLFRVKE